jgi:hypothetical protein
MWKGCTVLNLSILAVVWKWGSMASNSSSGSPSKFTYFEINQLKARRELHLCAACPVRVKLSHARPGSMAALPPGAEERA